MPNKPLQPPSGEESRRTCENCERRSRLSGRALGRTHESQCMPTKTERQAALQAKLELLHGSFTGFPIVLAHGLPDYVLLQFAFDVFEQAGATILVTSGPSPRAAVANARAAFEAALDMYALIAEPSLYDEMGAFVRVCELLAQEDLRSLRTKATSVAGLPSRPVEGRSPDEIVHEESRAWEVDQEGVSVVYKRALTVARGDRRWKSHWSGLGSYTNVLEYVERKHGAVTGFKEIGAMWYRALTHQSHPGLRTGTRLTAHNEAGRLAFGPKDGDEAFPLAMAQVACEHAIDAMRLRRDLFH